MSRLSRSSERERKRERVREEAYVEERGSQVGKGKGRERRAEVRSRVEGGRRREHEKRKGKEKAAWQTVETSSSTVPSLRRTMAGGEVGNAGAVERVSSDALTLPHRFGSKLQNS